jgi:hypothetical protein
MWHVCALAVVFAALTGCTKTHRATQTASTPQPAPGTPAAVSSSSAATNGRPSGSAAASGLISKPAISLAQEQPTAPAPAAARQTSDVTSLLPLGRDSRTLPEDFKIGALADSQVGDADERGAMIAASSFLGRLVAGKVDAALLAPSTEGRISDMLDFGIQRGDIPSTFRLGPPKKHDSGEISASVRLLGDVGTSEGEISLARKGGHWLVSDFQISLDDLQVKREKPNERFFPSSYRWMLQE